MTEKRYTVQQLATLSGVSVRTLHHYDRVGLLVPAFQGENGYRYYKQRELMRLQQILSYREFGLSLDQIGQLLAQPAAARIDQLRAQREHLLDAAARYRRLSRSLDRTIANLTSLGGRHMNTTELYGELDPARQQVYRDEAEARHGEAAVARSAAVVEAMGPGQRKQQMDELADIELTFAHLLRQGVAPGDARTGAVVARHRHWVATMWGRPCTPAAHAGLAQVYLDTPDFRARYESIAVGLTDYLHAAILAHP